MRLRVIAAATLILASLPPAHADSPLDPFRRLLKDPGKTIDRVIQAKPAVPARAKAAPQPVPEPDTAGAPASEPEPEAAVVTAETAAPVAPEDMPIPRQRPEATKEAIGAARLPDFSIADAGPAQPDIDAAAAELARLAAEGKPVTMPESAAAPPPRAAPEGPPPVADDGPAAAPADIAEAQAADVIAAAEAEPEDGPDPIILPRPRPKIAALGPAKSPSGARLASLPAGDGPGAAASCAAGLAAVGIDAVAKPPIRDGACGVKAPIEVASLEGGAISLTARAVINCELAGELARWMREDVQPAARKHLGGQVTSLRIAASYVCRGRNNDPKAKLSEHSFGNAIDISAIKVSGVGWIEVGRAGSARASAFMRAIRAEACGPFTTVLGPGVTYHDDHFHFDLAKRRSAGPSKGLYCK